MKSADTAFAAGPNTVTGQPTRVRYGVLAFCCALSMITYLDRVCFGTVAIFIRREFGLNPEQLGYLFAAFTLAYACFEIPSGWLGDTFGPRKTLVRIVLWWSLFTALTGAVYPDGWLATFGATVPFFTLLAVRFLFGLGEAGAYPNIAGAFHKWFPFQERGSAKGAVWMAGRLAGGFTPLVVLALIQEPTVPADRTLHLSNPEVLTNLVRYDKSAKEYRGAIVVGPEGLRINDKKLSEGEVDFTLDGTTFVPALAKLTVAGQPVQAGRLTIHAPLSPSADEKKPDVTKARIFFDEAPIAADQVQLDVLRLRVAYWRHSFWIFGGLGVCWCVLFWFWFRDRPEQKASVNAAEVALIRAGETHATGARVRVPWGNLLRSANLWLLCAMYACASYGWYFNITYLPGFLEQQFGVTRGDKLSAEWFSFSFMAGLPLIFGAFACLLGGLLTDAFIRRTGNRRWGRRLFGVVGHGLCALCYFAALAVMWLAPGQAPLAMAWLFTLAISLAAFANDLTMGSAWASCIDVGGAFSGVVAGCMNTVGNLGGFCANLMTGWILQAYIGGIDRAADRAAYDAALSWGWTVNFIIFGAVYVLATLCWLRFDATRSIAHAPATS